MTICDVLKLLEFFTDMQFLEFSFEVFLKINLSSIKISWYTVNVLAFQISDFEYTTNYSTKHMKL